MTLFPVSLLDQLEDYRAARLAGKSAPIYCTIKGVVPNAPRPEQQVQKCQNAQTRRAEETAKRVQQCLQRLKIARATDIAPILGLSLVCVAEHLKVVGEQVKRPRGGSPGKYFKLRGEG